MPLDIGVGILLSIVVANWYQVSLSPFFVLLGILAALAPDLDIVPLFWRTTYDHRSFPHYPIVQVVLTCMVYGLLGPMYATLYGLGVFIHLLHDSIGLGWGVMWFWPVSRRKFLFLPIARMKTYGYFMTWMREEERQLGADYHDPHWIRHYYFSSHPIAFIEYGVLLFAFAVWWYVG